MGQVHEKLVLVHLCRSAKEGGKGNWVSFCYCSKVSFGCIKRLHKHSRSSVSLLYKNPEGRWSRMVWWLQIPSFTLSSLLQGREFIA